MSRDPEAEACRALWQSVVMAAVKDAILPEDSHGETALHRQQAREWFRGAGRDYHMVCALSGIDPDMLREAVLEGRIRPEDLVCSGGRPRLLHKEVPAQ